MTFYIKSPAGIWYTEKGVPVSYNFRYGYSSESEANSAVSSLSLTDVDNVDYVLKRLSLKGFDVALIELSAMVESISSFDRIAKQFGVSEETVYLAKGLCR